MSSPDPAAADAPLPRGLRSLLSRTGTVTAGNLLFVFLGFVSNWLLARSLGTSGFGTLARTLAAFQIGQEVLGRGLTWAQIRIGSRPGVDEAAVVATTRALHVRVGLGMLVPFAAVALFALPWLRDADPREGWLLLGAGISAFFSNFVWHAMTVHQARERYASYAGLTVGSAVVRLCGYVALWLFGVLQVATAVCAHLATSALTAFLALRSVDRTLGGRKVAVDPVLRADLLTYAQPLIVATTLSTLATQIDVFLVSLFRANEQVAHYRVAALLITALELVIVAAIVVLTPEAGRAFTPAARRRALLRSTLLAGVVGGLALATWPCAELITWPFGAEYAPAAHLYSIMLIGTVVNALTHPLSVSFFAEDRPGRFVWVHAFSLAFLVVGDLLVLPEQGVVGGAWIKNGMRGVQAVMILAWLWFDMRRRADKAV